MIEILPAIDRVPTGQEKVRKKRLFLKVRKKAGKFDICQENPKFGKMSGTSQDKMEQDSKDFRLHLRLWQPSVMYEFFLCVP